MNARLISDMPAETYHADPCERPSLSTGVAKLLLGKSPRAAWMAHPKLNPAYQPESDRSAFDIGTSAHAVLLEGTDKNIVVVDADDWRTNAAKSARADAWAAGKSALLRHQADRVIAMVAAAKVFIGQSELAELWAAAKSEQTILWEENGVWMRCRHDRLTDDRLVSIDYKTTGDASPAVFTRHMVAMDYHLQDAIYRRGVRALGLPDPKFVFFAQETEAPYECALYGCDPHMREIAEAQVERAIALWRECLESNRWPGYGGRVHWAAPPIWLQMEHEEAAHAVGV